MAQEKICGIYCIENKINGKRYIGQSVNIYRRWSNHISVLNNNYHFNDHLQKAWVKYGEAAFVFSILEKCSKEDLNTREKYWIEHYDSFNSGYNLTIGGDGTLGSICSEEKKAKISKAKIGKKLTEEQKQRVSKGLLNSPNVLRGENHPYFQRKLNDTEILRLRNGIKQYYEENNHTPPWSKKVICVTTGKIFDTMTKGAAEYNIKAPANISSCCSHKREFAGELPDGTRLQWEWYVDGKTYDKKEQVYRSNKERPIIQYDLNHNYIREWKSAKECCDNTGISRSKICNVCKGQRRQTGGYIFEYKTA